MTRQALVVALVLGASVTAGAQSTQPSIGLPLPPIGLPLPPIGLPVRDIVTSPTPSAPPAPPNTPPVPSPPAIVFFGVAPYAWGFEPWQQSSRPGMISAPEPPQQTEPPVTAESGRLQIEVSPRHAQIYVDGEFVGTWSDLEGSLELTPGTHRIEIRAPRHEALTFDVRIVAGRTITYRGSLNPIGEQRDQAAAPSALTPSDVDAPAAAPARPKPQTFYLIPGCYLGNIPPEQVKLPSGCDLSRLITHTPGQ